MLSKVVVIIRNNMIEENPNSSKKSRYELEGKYARKNYWLYFK